VDKKEKSGENYYFTIKLIHLMKYLQLTLVCILFNVLPAFAQFRVLVSHSLRIDIQKVVAEYAEDFKNIRGEILNQNPQTIEYASNLKLNDAQECSITRYSSGSKPIYSWQALMFASEEYDLAANKYKWLFNQLKGMNVYYIRDQYTLKGHYEEPDESKKFSTTTFTLQSPPTPLKKLKIEIAMQFEFPEWKVNLLVYEKEKEDDERGATEE